MLVTCPACKKQHRVEHTNIPSQAQKARCSASSAIFPLQILTEKTGQHEVGATRQRRISVAISKGGVGKTTTAVNLAAGLACNGQKTLLIDTDTQGQDSFHLGVHPKKGLANLILGEASADEALVKA